MNARLPKTGGMSCRSGSRKGFSRSGAGSPDVRSTPSSSSGRTSWPPPRLEVDTEALKIARNLGYIKHDALFGRLHPLANPEVAKISGSYEHLVRVETPAAAPAADEPGRSPATPRCPRQWLLPATDSQPGGQRGRPRPAAPRRTAPKKTAKVAPKKAKKAAPAKKKPVQRRKPRARKKTSG